jgi:hypothetical protein
VVCAEVSDFIVVGVRLQIGDSPNFQGLSCLSQFGARVGLLEQVRETSFWLLCGCSWWWQAVDLLGLVETATCPKGERAHV